MYVMQYKLKKKLDSNVQVEEGLKYKVSVGYYSTPLSMDIDKKTGQVICPLGYFCSGGMKIELCVGFEL